MWYVKNLRDAFLLYVFVNFYPYLKTYFKKFICIKIVSICHHFTSAFHSCLV